MPADETALAIHHHDLAVVAEIHLEAVEHAAAGAEAMHLHAALAQPLDIAVRQRVAADGVIEEEHLDAVGRTFQQQLLEALAEGVVADDEELHQDHLAGGGNRLEHRLEAGLAVDQQAHPVVRQGRRAGHPHQRLEPLVAADLAGRQGLLDPGTPVQLGGRQVHLGSRVRYGMNTNEVAQAIAPWAVRTVSTAWMAATKPSTWIPTSNRPR